MFFTRYTYSIVFFWPFSAHLSHRLMVCYCHRWSQSGIINNWFHLTYSLDLTELGRTDPYIALFNNCSNGSSSCISKSNGGGGIRVKTLKILSKTTKLMLWFLVWSIEWTSTKFVQIMALRPKMAPPHDRKFYIGLYRENLKRYRALLFSMWHHLVDL